MADAETLLNLAAHEAAVAEFLAEHDGRLLRDQQDPSIYWLDIRPRTERHERYYPRLAWRAYPHAPASVLFAEGVGGPLGVLRTWPRILGYRAPNDICKPFTAEGYAIHSEWTAGPDAWPTEGNPFLWVAELLQYDLDNGYSGRAG